MGGKLGLVGAGAMAEALVAGVTAAGLYGPDRIVVTNRRNLARRRELACQYGICTAASLEELCLTADLLVLAVKPVDAAEVLARLARTITDRHTLVSVVAGLSLAALQSQLPAGMTIIRAMPNTSCAVSQSATALAWGEGVGAGMRAQVLGMFTAIGQVVELPEHLIDAATGLAGSGPAYVYYLVEALVEAGRQAGLPGEVAESLARQTLYGAAVMLQRTGADPAALRAKVTSPGGTTMAGVETLERAGVRGAVKAAVKAAAKRAGELGKPTTGMASGTE
ncbi:MAG: pyrroline-5-carboxylate reductase [Bacillota bacterium]